MSKLELITDADVESVISRETKYIGPREKYGRMAKLRDLSSSDEEDFRFKLREKGVLKESIPKNLRNFDSESDDDTDALFNARTGDADRDIAHSQGLPVAHPWGLICNATTDGDVAYNVHIKRRFAQNIENYNKWLKIELKRTPPKDKETKVEWMKRVELGVEFGDLHTRRQRVIMENKFDGISEISKSEFDLILDEIYAEINKRCNKRDSDIIDNCCPYGCDNNWESSDYDDITEGVINEARKRYRNR